MEHKTLQVQSMGREAEELDPSVAEAGPSTISKVRPQRLCFSMVAWSPVHPRTSTKTSTMLVTVALPVVPVACLVVFKDEQPCD